MKPGLKARPAEPLTAPEIDLGEEMAALWSSLGAVGPERGRVVQFVSATSGEGASTIAREFAFYAAQRARRPVWLVDLDIFGATQHQAVNANLNRFGPCGRPAAASPDGSTFFSVQPPEFGPNGQPRSNGFYLSARPVAGGKLWVTRFHAESLKPGQTVSIARQARYWSALRAHAEYVIVDAPAADRSTAALTLAPVVDTSVLVLAAETGDARAPAGLKASLEGAGGKVAGLVFNRAKLQPPPFLQKLL